MILRFVSAVYSHFHPFQKTWKKGRVSFRQSVSNVTRPFFPLWSRTGALGLTFVDRDGVVMITTKQRQVTRTAL